MLTTTLWLGLVYNVSLPVYVKHLERDTLTYLHIIIIYYFICHMMCFAKCHNIVEVTPVSLLHIFVWLNAVRKKLKTIE